MAKKNTLKANKLPVLKLKDYDVAFQSGDKVERVEVSATNIDSDFETLKAFIGDELVGEFREWLYYVRVDDDEEEVECVEKRSKLPKDFGLVDGKVFGGPMFD